MSDTKEAKDKSDFTPREMEIMTLAWTCMTEEPKVNYDKLADACGMGNPRSASNAWANIKKKIIAKAGIVKEDANGDGGEGGASPTKKTPKATPRKRAAKATANGDDAEAEESPTKKAKPTPKGKKNKVKSEPVVEDEGEGEGEGKENGVKTEQE